MAGGPPLSAHTTHAAAVLVTGGGGPKIGSGIAQAVAERGYAVWVADADGDAAKRVAGELAGRGLDAASVVLDVTDPRSVAEAVDEVVDRHGSIHGLVNSAGIGAVVPSAEMSEAQFDRVMGIDVRGVWLCTRAVVPVMVSAGGGSVVNISSVHALATDRGYAAYAAAKSGLLGLTRGVAHDYGPSGVRCNVVLPGAVSQNQRVFDLAREGHGSVEPRVADFARRRQMLHRPVEPIDIGRTVAFLLSDDARAITAAEIVVDGGLSAMLFADHEL